MLNSLKKLVEMARPDLSIYMRFPVQGEVTAVDAAHYTCVVQPLDAKMSLLPKCRILTIWATKTTRIVALPAVGDRLMVGFENGDHTKPYIEGFLPDQGPPGLLLIEAKKARIEIGKDGQVKVISDADVEIACVNSFTEILDDLMTELVARTPFTNLNPSAAVRGLLEVIAKVVADLYALLKIVMAQSFVQTATGAWLDLKVREMGIVCHPAVKAKVRLTFSSSSPADRSVTIPAGTICKSQKDANGKDYRFITTAEAVIEEGGTSVEVVAEAESPGAAWNVGDGMITRIVTRIAGIEAVVNGAGSLLREGSDSESDEQLRTRAITTWERLGLGGTREAYRNWALSVPGVTAASVLDDFPFGPGTVGVVILGANGIPTPVLLDEVHQYIKARKPLTADVRVLAPRIVTQNLSLEVVRFADADQTGVETAIRLAISEFSRRLQLGEGLIFARLIDVLMDVVGVYNLKVMAPARDILIGVDSFLSIGEVSITHRIKGRVYQDSGITGSGGNAATDQAQIAAVDKARFGLDE